MTAQHRSHEKAWSSRRVVLVWAVVIVLAVIMLILFGRYGINPNAWAQHVLGHRPTVWPNP